MEPYEYRIKGEPRAHDAPADYDRLFEILLQKAQAERSRSDGMDTKAATLFAGTIAMLGFSLERSDSILQAVLLLAFAWPGWHLFHAYKPLLWKDAPSAKEVIEKFPWFPQTTVASAAVALAQSIEDNRPKIDFKAREVLKGFRAILIVTASIVVLRIIFLAAPGVHSDKRIQGTATASAGSTDAAKPNGILGKSAQSPKVAIPGPSVGGVHANRILRVYGGRSFRARIAWTGLGFAEQ